jgi:hypothetical protein
LGTSKKFSCSDSGTYCISAPLFFVVLDGILFAFAFLPRQLSNSFTVILPFVPFAKIGFFCVFTIHLHTHTFTFTRTTTTSNTTTTGNPTATYYTTATCGGTATPHSYTANQCYGTTYMPRYDDDMFNFGDDLVPPSISSTPLPTMPKTPLSYTYSCQDPVNSKAPTTKPTRAPSTIPSKSPTVVPTAKPTKAPTATPTKSPKPTKKPSAAPTTKSNGTPAPSVPTTPKPSQAPVIAPSAEPSAPLTRYPSAMPATKTSRAPTAAGADTVVLMAEQVRTASIAPPYFHPISTIFPPVLSIFPSFFLFVFPGV